MEQAASISCTRRSVVAGLTLTAASAAVLEYGKAAAQEKIFTNGWEVSLPSQPWWITSATPS